MNKNKLKELIPDSSKYEEIIKRNNAGTISKRIREVYSQDAVEAILSNYLNDPSDEKAKKEFDDFQAYRQQVKTDVKGE